MVKYLEHVETCLPVYVCHAEPGRRIADEIFRTPPTSLWSINHFRLFKTDLAYTAYETKQVCLNS